jgi:hypothetical protein
MGFGSAFAIGFLKGTNEKIAAKRQAEADAAAAEREMQGELVQAVLGMEDIDFGAPGTQAFFANPSYQALAGLSRTVDDVENKLTYGNFSIAKPEDWDKTMNDGDLFVRGSAWLRFHNEIMANPTTRDTFVSALQSDSRAMSTFVNDLARYTGFYADGYVDKNTNVVSGAVSGYVPAEENYRSLFSTTNTFLPVPSQVVDPANDKIIKNAEESGDIQNASTSVVVTVFGDNEEQRVPYDFGDKYNNLERMSTALNYPNVQAFVDDFKDVSRAENPEEAYSVLIAATDLEGLGAGDFNRTAGVNEATAQRIGMFMLERFGDDRIMMAQAMAPLMVLDEDSVQKGNNRRVVKMQPAAYYFEKYLKINIDDLQRQYSESQETVNELNRLAELVDKDTTPTGFVAALKNVFGGAFGDKGQIDQLLGNNVLGVSTQELLQDAFDNGFINTTVIADLSEIEALKLTLAAKMARAVDPSGRLSNQDFEVQLRRLGQDGFFTGKVQSETKLKTVISDFEKRLSRIQVLHTVATSPTFGMREARILRADRAVQFSLDASYKASKSGTAPAPVVAADTQEAPKSLTLNQELGFYTDGNAFYLDEQGTQLVPMDILDAAIEAAYGE